MRICPRCELPGEFRIGSRQCKACDKSDRTRDSEKIAARMRRYAEQNPHRVWASGTITNHRRKGFRVLFSAQELAELAKSTQVCPICGVELRFSFGTKGGKCAHDSPTLDRKDNGEELNLSDVQVLCLRCNTTKGNRTMKEFVDYCELVALKRAELVKM